MKCKNHPDESLKIKTKCPKGHRWISPKEKKQNGNKMLCLQDTIWDSDVPAIVEFMRNNGIKKFAIATGQSSIIETFGIFQEHGVKIKGVETMKSRHKKFWSDEYEDIPAMIMEVKYDEP